MSSPLAGLTVLVTGTVQGLSRDAAIEAVRSLGATTAGGVSGKVDLVVAGEGAGVAKMAKARQFGCRILSGDDFLNLLSNPNAPIQTPIGVTHDAWEAATDATVDDGTGAREPRPGEPGDINFADRHLVGRASNFLRLPDGTWEKRFQCRCQCGHAWSAPIQYDTPTACPVETGTVRGR